MKPITNIAELDARITQLEIEQMNEMVLLKAQFKAIRESIKPINLIKNVIRNIKETPNLKSNLLNTMLSYATGYLAKKIVVGSTHNPIKQILGMMLQTGVTNAVSNNADDIKSLIVNIIKNKLQKKLIQ